MRESPAIDVIDFLLREGADIVAYDPQAMENARRIFDDRISYSSDGFTALEGVDALVVATEWNEFRHPDFEQLFQLMKGKVIFDGRNLFNPERMRALGFKYYGVGQL